MRFDCTRCSRCCRHEPGFVFLTKDDLSRLVKAVGVPETAFLARYTKRVRLGTTERVSLNEKKNYDCVFWENDGCSVYEARPLQCRSYPFWISNVDAEASWERTARECPGIGLGPIHTREEIDDWLARRRLAEYLGGPGPSPDMDGGRR